MEPLQLRQRKLENGARAPVSTCIFSAFVRALGDPWSFSETSDVSATGAFFVTERPFLLNTPVEYVLTFPPDLTKAAQPLRVRFFGMVLRCERRCRRREASSELQYGTLPIAI